MRKKRSREEETHRIGKKRRHRNLIKPLYPEKLPVHSFQMVFGDFCTMAPILLVVDPYGKWPYYGPLRGTTYESIIAALERILLD